MGCVEEDNCILVTTNKDFIGGSATSTGTIMTTNATIVVQKMEGLWEAQLLVWLRDLLMKQYSLLCVLRIQEI